MPVQGRVDGMGGGRASGWARAGDRHCRITVTDEAGALVASGEARQPRADLASLGLGRTDLAFRLALPESPARRVFRIYADGVELPGSPLAGGPGLYDGDCVIAAGICQGWVQERVARPGEPGITLVTQHGEIVGQGHARHDLRDSETGAAFAIALDDRCFGAGELRISVLVDGVCFRKLACDLKLRGAIELLTPEACAGWLSAADAPQRRLRIEVFRNGVPVALAACEGPRRDLAAAGTGAGDCGFSARFPGGPELGTAPARISLRLPGSPVELFEGPYMLGPPAAAILAAQNAAAAIAAMPELPAAERAVAELALQRFLRAARNGDALCAPRQFPAAAKSPLRLTVIIPIHRDVAATRLCIDAVLRVRNAATDRLLLIDDAAPEPGMAGLLDGYENEPNLHLLRNAENLGFVKTVNRGLGFAPPGDVLLLNSDTRVFPGAFDELCAIAHSAGNIGTVTAISDNATIFSYPGQDLRAADCPTGDLADCLPGDVAEAALRLNAGLALEVPTAHGFCMLIRGEVLRKIGGFDESFGRGYAEENAFCRRAADAGFRHVAAAGVFVQHGETRSFGAEKAGLLRRNLPLLHERYPEYAPALDEFIRRDGLRAARWALDGWRLQRVKQAGARYVLEIGNHLGGGSARAAEAIAAAAPEDGLRLRLACREDGDMTLGIEAPGIEARFAPGEIEPLFSLLEAAAPEQVRMHQLLGFGEAFLLRLQAWVAARPSSYFVHDFYPLCPRVTCLDAAGDFCNVAATNICERCIALAGPHDAARLGLKPAAHRAFFARLLANAGQVIAPSASAAALLRRGFPELPVTVTPHPEPAIAARPSRQAEDMEEITLFGALGPHKGCGKLLEIARRARLARPSLRFRVIGCTAIDSALLEIGNVTITGRYTSADLPRLAAQARGSLALFLHAWPETYSYTLSEALRFGFLPLVPDLGAPPERLRALRSGLIYPANADAAAILHLIEDVLAGRSPSFTPETAIL